MLSNALRSQSVRAATRVHSASAGCAVRRNFWSSSSPEPVKETDELVAIPEVEKLLRDGIRSIGYNNADTEVMKDAMMWAQLRNNNQGIIKLTSGGLAKSSDAEPTIENESPVGARINGNQAMSMVVLERGVRLAIEKAKACNIGVVGTYNTSQSCGALGFYTEKIASQGMIGIIMATSPEFVAPFGAKQPILGTNPIACGVPTDQGLMLMDQATAAFPWFGLLEAKTAGIQIPEGVAYDADGHPTRDPNAALKGALRTFDRGYKSSNLALMVELLAGPLVGAAHMDKLSAKNWGNLVIAVHPSMLGDAKTFYKSAGEVLQRVQNADKLPGVKEIIIPGSKEAVLAQSRIDAGAVPLEKNMLNELRVMAANYDGMSQAGSSAGDDRQLQLLEQLVSRLDKIEQTVAATQQQQHQLSRQQERLETVTAESLRGFNGMQGGGSNRF